MSKIKTFQDLVNNFFELEPKEVDVVGSTNFQLYKKELYNLFKSRFIFENIPNTWDVDYLKDNLFKCGYMGIVSHNGFTYCLRCGYSGLNVYEKPTDIIIANPVLGSFENKIGIDGTLLYFNYNFGNYQSIDSFIRSYAVKLSQCDCSINTTLMNSRVSMIFNCKNESERQSAIKIYSDVTHGKPAVFLNNNGLSEIQNPVLFNNVKNTYVGNEMLLTKKEIMNEFLTRIGINNANTNKRERINIDEVNANNEEVRTLINDYIDTINNCFDEARKIDKLNVGDVKCRMRELKQDDISRIDSIIGNV